jgi:hypothetical protein
LKSLVKNAKLSSLLSTGTEEGLPGGLDATSSRISKKNKSQMPSQMAASANSSNLKKRKGPGGGRRKISRRRGNATSVF